MNHQVKSCWVVETPIFISNVALVIMRKFKAPQGVTNYCKLKTICMNSEWCQKWRCALSLSVIVINTIIRQHLKSEWNCSGTTNEREMIRKPRFLQTCWRIFQTRFFFAWLLSSLFYRPKYCWVAKYAIVLAKANWLFMMRYQVWKKE